MRPDAPQVGSSRRALLVGAAALAFGCGPGVVRQARADAPSGEARYRDVLEGARARAVAAGVPPGRIAEALRGLSGPDERVLALSRKQSEFSRPLGLYVAGAASPGRTTAGRALRAKWTALLGEIEARFGVPGDVVLAVWGMESEFGAASGGFEVLRSLATLASIGYRAPLFEDELVAALRILDAERMGRAELLGSWAGAMGQAQFMPSSYLAAAIDQDGDGRRDIWRSVPDVLGSIAHLLARKGWMPGLPAAFEVTLPARLDLALHHDDIAGWRARGLVRPGNAPLPASGDASLFLPAGIAGPAFLLTRNFEAIRAYNTSDAYALGIVRLAETIAGGGALARPWPPGPDLSGAERAEVQSRLAAMGLYDGQPDGRAGARTRDAVRRFQVRRGLLADAYAGPALLRELRAER